MTLMVRDEADIIVPMIEYHLSAGVDVMLITDNGSRDGTRELLDLYSADSRVTVLDEPESRGEQARIVTGMARRAATDFDATWVINADADEFFVPVDRSLSLRDIFRMMPTGIASATIPVVDMTGVPARQGAGFARLTYRDQRSDDDLYEVSGLRSHATHDAIHVGAADVEVAHGNHYVSIASCGEIPMPLRLESLHFPWRSYAQFSRKVINAGAAYSSNPSVTPSPHHHGMRDYRFYRAGVLEEIYLYRHPMTSDTPSPELPPELWLLERLRELVHAPSTILPERLSAALDDSSDDPYSDSGIADAAHVARAVLLVEDERATAEVAARRAAGDRAFAEEAVKRAEALQRDNDELSSRLLQIEQHLLYRGLRSIVRVIRVAILPFRSIRAWR